MPGNVTEKHIYIFFFGLEKRGGLGGRDRETPAKLSC